jgi:serine/threonine protein kinase
MRHENVVNTKIKSFNFMKNLDEGAWGVVYEAFDSNTNSKVAIKAIPQILMKQTPKLKELVDTEIQVLKECKN